MQHVKIYKRLQALWHTLYHDQQSQPDVHQRSE